ncbi:hypothetical protein TWF694_007214 [Orbilia ellipsospora]|uniref:Uncharacterized protein n=1 Tax=Orbilia ellipsospora TaxID=2528407 RepID=A0AAV9XKG9_9PEZI
MQCHLMIRCILVSLLALLTTLVGGHPIRQTSLVPYRHRHWTGIMFTTNPAYASDIPPKATNTEYEEFLKAKATGENPTSTFRPDSWSQYNHHLEERSVKEPTQIEMDMPPAWAAILVQENTTSICNASLMPNNYCPKTSQQLAIEAREQRRGLFGGTIIAILSAILLTTIYFLNYKFFRYFEYKEKWHIERARTKNIRRVNLSLVKSGVDKPFPENLDTWVLTHPPSTFWAGIFESEWFIALLYFIERRTEMKGKYTGLMKRPKLGDEASGIPLNSPRARRKYGRRGPSVPVVPPELLEAARNSLPLPISSHHRRDLSSRIASINSIQIQSGKNPFNERSDSNASTNASRDSIQGTPSVCDSSINNNRIHTSDENL